jgi:anti-sigma factor RsiW
VSHLGDRVTALVDGQLPIDATERAHAHLAGCPECREAVEAERLIKSRLSVLTGPEPAGDLVGRLLAMGGPSGPLPPRPGHVPGSPRPQPVTLRRPTPTARPAPAVPGRPPTRPGVSRRAADPARPADGRPAGRPEPRPVRTARLNGRARLAGAVLGALGVVGAGVGGLVLNAPQISVSTSLSPAVDAVVARPTVTGPAATDRMLPMTVVRGAAVVDVRSASSRPDGR